MGANKSEFGPRFPPLSDAYDVQLQQIAAQSVCEMSLAHALRHGTYTCVSGPSYETPTEASFLRSVGGDVVGMSTIPEVRSLSLPANPSSDCLAGRSCC